ncbi:helix-hairpin-helix domain-containing protein [Streptomyces gossypii]|uniref:helix-hairpin-helix domain-containing protein n=1 Tax=Streptomyces gossypii TaxID=2883101 RepID=UPI0035CD2658
MTTAVTTAADADPAGRRPRRGRWSLAVRERLPLWLQLRCGVEPRTLAALAVVLLLAVGFAVHHFWSGRPQTVRAPQAAAPGHPPGTSAGPTGASAAPGGMASPGGPAARPGGRVIVDVAGKVRRPGIRTLPPGSRVADALKASGGLRPGTDAEGLNRARLLVDGEQIVAGASPAPAPGGGPPGAEPGATGAPPTGTRISLGSATAEQLETLPGIGPVLAQHIIDYRDERGGFRSVDELREVNGIGEARFADLEPQVGL